jgi:predicted kinase
MDDATDAEDVAGRTAATVWQEVARGLGRRPKPRYSLLIQTAGTPLSGKSSVARALAAAVPTALLHVENDVLRERIALALGRPPQQDRYEHFITYRAAWALSRRAIKAGAHALHDATNLTERGRAPGYALAEALGVPVFVVFVVTDDETLRARAERLPADRQAAWEKYHGRAAEIAGCTRPHIVLDGAQSIEDSLDALRAEPALRPLWTVP